MSIRIPEGGTVLFQGDSITDCGRSRRDDGQLGEGYANMVAAWYTAAHSKRRVRFLNRGVSGSRMNDLQRRWQIDCIDLRPNVLSILIGINDVCRRYDCGDPTSCDAFEAGYRDLLSRVRDKLHGGLLLLEPFLVPTSPSQEIWHEDLDPKRAVVRELAEEFDATFVPLQQIFRDASGRSAPAFWATDGVHPSLPGHELIARAWLSAIDA